MTYARLIDGLRWCADESICCDDFSGEKCPYFDEKKDSCSVDEILHAAADALEAAEQRIAELEAQLPKEGECDKVRTVGRKDGFEMFCLLARNNVNVCTGISLLPELRRADERITR